MKITCPQCGASGNLPDHEIPEEGRFLSCPKCKHGFDVKKPKATANEYLVDSCPACAYSTFGEERFGTCPKCGVDIKTYVGRQREEMTRAREQQMLTRKFSREIAVTAPIPMPPSSSMPSMNPQSETKHIDITEMIENLHPVNLIGYGTCLVAVVILLMGLYGIFDYYGTDYVAKIPEESIELGIVEKPSSIKIFMQHGLVPLIETIYGAALLMGAVLFLQKKAQALQALSWLFWALIAYVPAYNLIIFVSHFFESSKRSVLTYLSTFLQMVLVSALVGFPLYLLINFLNDKRIRSVVKL